MLKFKTMKLILATVISLLSLTALSQDSINCNEHLNRTVDDFSGEITIEAKITDDASFIKIKTGNIIRYYLSIYIAESGIYNGKGVTIILQNGKKINKPNELVESTYIAGNFYTRAFIRLTTNDIQLLKQSGIVKYKLYISSDELTESNSNWSKVIFNCLLNSK